MSYLVEFAIVYIIGRGTGIYIISVFYGNLLMKIDARERRKLGFVKSIRLKVQVIIKIRGAARGAREGEGTRLGCLR